MKLECSGSNAETEQNPYAVYIELGRERERERERESTRPLTWFWVSPEM